MIPTLQPASRPPVGQAERGDAIFPAFRIIGQPEVPSARPDVRSRLSSPAEYVNAAGKGKGVEASQPSSRTLDQGVAGRRGLSALGESQPHSPVIPPHYPSVTQGRGIETRDDPDIEMGSPNGTSPELPFAMNTPTGPAQVDSANNDCVLKKVKLLTSLCHQYIQLAYSIRMNGLNIQAHDHRIGTLLLALLELIAQRGVYSERHQVYLEQMAATLKKVEGIGCAEEATSLRGAQANIDDAMQALNLGDDPTTVTSTFQIYREVADESGQPVMAIPLAMPESKMGSDAVRELGKYLVESPLSVYRALFMGEDSESEED